MKPWIETGFGSAGAGNRTGRKTARTTGRIARSKIQSSDDRDGKILAKSPEHVRLKDPTKAELEEAMRDGFCWWCGATHTKCGREITSWGGHWAKAHGMALQPIRDILEVPKHTGLTTPELNKKLSRLHKERFSADPELGERMRAARDPHAPRNLSKAFMASQAEKAKKQDPDRLRRLGRAQALRAKYQRQPIHCEECGVLFSPLKFGGRTGAPVKGTRRTCSDECWNAVRRKKRQENAILERIEKPCTVCGEMFWSRVGRATCSKECEFRSTRKFAFCAICKKEFWIPRKKSPGRKVRKTCSKKCEFEIRSRAGKINSRKRFKDG